MYPDKERHKVFYGWYIVGACLFITLYTGGVIHFGFTAVFEPIAEEFGWSYAQISLAASLRGLEMGLLAPLMGFLVDRWGPRRLIVAGSIFVCTGFLLLSRISSLTMYYIAFAFISVGMSTCAGTVLLTAVTNWFRKKAALAIGLVASGFGLGGIIVPVVTKLIDVLEWRMAMVTVGLGMLVTVLPLSFIVRHKPEPYGYLPDGEASLTVKTKEAEISAPSAETSISVMQAIRNRAFWHIAITSMCHSFVIGAVVTHLMPYLSSLGIARSLSSLVALFLPVASIGGRLSSGWLTDRFGKRKIYAACFVSVTAGLLLFASVAMERMWLLVPFIITFSFGWGCSVTTRLTLQVERFGRGSFGRILGFLSGLMMLGNMSGAPLAGWVFDTWGSYTGAWLAFSAPTIIATILALTIPSANSTLPQ
jgi:OFA family oxalate/formate antiporter-like MFS transporter